MGKESLRRFKDTEEDDSSVVTRERRQRGAEVEMKRLMGGAPEVVSTIQTNQNTDLETQEVVLKDKPWLRPGVIESALMPRIVQPAEKPKADVVSAEADEEALGKVLGNDIWEELQKHEESKIPAEISQIYGDQTPPIGVLELYKKLNSEKRAEYITDLRIFEEKNKQQNTSLTAPTVPATVEPLAQAKTKSPEVAPSKKIEPLIQVETKPGLATEWQDEAVPLGRIMPRVVPADTGSLIQVETKKISNEAVAHEEEEQAAIDARITAAHEEPATPKVEESNRDLIVETPGSKAEFVGEKGTHKKWGDFEDIEHKDTSQTEGTPKEWRDKLRETVAWWASPSERLIRRNAELEAQAEKIPGMEKVFRALGEKYNKLPFWQKAALGASLGLGAVFTAGTLVAAIPLLGLASQRIAGLSTMYLKFEKKSHDEKLGKEKAFLKAAVYTAVMGLAIKEGIEYVSETESAHVVQKWLGETLGHFSLFGATHAPVHPAEVPKVSASAPEVATQSAAVASAPEVPQPAAAAAAGGEVAATAAAPEIPGIEVTATPGHGYEYMMKRLWEDLHAKGIKLPLGANPDSDLARLLEIEKGDEAGINKLVHKLAEENEWFKENGGTNAVIGEHAKMTIDTHGDIWIDHKDIIAPESAHVTPAYHPEVPTVPIEEPLVPLTPVDIVSPGPVQPNLSDLVSPNDTSASVSEAPMPAAPITENIIVNNSRIDVSTTQPHLYNGKGDSIIAFGGQKADRLKEMLNYLKSNPDKTIIAADSSEKFRAVWSLNAEGKLEQGALLNKPGLFGFLIPDSSPSPDDLTKLIK